jgi:hypothetical protein
VVDQYATHQARGDAEEMSAILPPDVARVDQAQERFVHQGGCLKRVFAPFVRHAGTRQPAQFHLHERNQALERRRITVAPRPQQFGDCLRRRGPQNASLD